MTQGLAVDGRGVVDYQGALKFAAAAAAIGDNARRHLLTSLPLWTASYDAGAIEAGISYLKRCFGLSRCHWKGLARISHHDDGAGLIFDSATHFLQSEIRRVFHSFRKCLVNSNLCTIISPRGEICGLAHYKAYVWSSIFTHNLVVLGRLRPVGAERSEAQRAIAPGHPCTLGAAHAQRQPTGAVVDFRDTR
ncbi:MAG: hypothetical protein ACR2RB_10025 [Gammaproteobacteria bacterium]